MNPKLRIFVTGDSLQNYRFALPNKLHGDSVEWVPLPVLQFERLPVAADILTRVVEKPFGWVLFSSPRAVEFWSETLIEMQIDFPLETQVACMGEGTAAAAEFDGFTPDFFPTEPGTDGFLAEFEALIANNLDKPSVLLPAAERGRPRVRERLAELGCEVVWFPLYRTAAREDLEEVTAQLHAAPDQSVLIFTSPSSVDAVLDGAPLPAGLRPVAIGEFTADHLRSRGIEPVLLPSGEFHRLEEVL